VQICGEFERMLAARREKAPTFARGPVSRRESPQFGTGHACVANVVGAAI
jgi:hypothetical protein